MAGSYLGDEKLRVVRIRSSLGIRQYTRAVVLKVQIELIIEVTQCGSSRSGSRRITGLDHEAIDHTVEDDIARCGLIVKAGVDQLLELIDRTGSFVGKQAKNHLAIAIDIHANRLGVVDQLGRYDVGVAAGHTDGQWAAVGIVRVDRNVDRRTEPNRLVGDFNKRRLRSGRNRNSRNRGKLLKGLESGGDLAVGELPGRIGRDIFSRTRRVLSAIWIARFDERKVVLALEKQFLLFRAKGTPVGTEEFGARGGQSFGKGDQIRTRGRFALGQQARGRCTWARNLCRIGSEWFEKIALGLFRSGLVEVRGHQLPALEGLESDVSRWAPVGFDCISKHPSDESFSLEISGYPGRSLLIHFCHHFPYNFLTTFPDTSRLGVNSSRLCSKYRASEVVFPENWRKRSSQDAVAND